MADPKQTLTESEIRTADLPDWRQVNRRIGARFATGDFAAGVAFVDRIGAAAEEAGHHPDITLTYPEVTVWLSSHDVGGLTSRDLDLARTISGLAAEAGIGSDPSGLLEVEVGLDTHASQEVAPFHAALLGQDPGEFGAARGDDGPDGGSTDDDREVVADHGDHPSIWFQPAEQIPAPPQRYHLDVWVPHDQAEARLAAVIAAGGTLVDDTEAPAFWVVVDAQGNRACICTTLTRDD